MDLHGRHALVIEADAHSLLVIGNLLKGVGITYKRNTTGYDVMAQVRRMTPKLDFILLDVDLPQGDVYAICSELMNDPLVTIPVITIAEHFTPEMLVQAAHCGVAACVDKPLPRHCFADIIALALSEERGVNPPVHYTACP